MKFPLLLLAALGILLQVTSGGAGGTRCGRGLLGRCRLQCHPGEVALFLCDRYKQCCVEQGVLPKPIESPRSARLCA